MKIAIAGTGYVGLSNALLLAQHNEVVAHDIVAAKVQMINDKVSPIDDHELAEYVKPKPLNLRAWTDPKDAYAYADSSSSQRPPITTRRPMTSTPIRFKASSKTTRASTHRP
jgi:UDP-glucose 6-dehydrogenase